jgi:ABC-2 type transport system permease protein
MQVYWTLVRRELSAYFFSMTGYVVIAAAVFLTGGSFALMLAKLQDTPTPMPVTELFFATPFFWLILLLTAPVITMRLFAHEKFSGTFETLMTAPVSDRQVVLAKFSAAWLFHLLVWLPLLANILILRRYTSEAAALDAAAVGGTFLGIALLGGTFMALGLFASALSRSQIIAAMVCLVGGVSLFLISFLGEKLDGAAGWWGQSFAYLNLFDHMDDFARGVVDTRAVVLLLTLTGLFLFLTLRVVESRRWR